MNQPHKHKKFSWENWIRRFYGVQNLDEYRMAEINKIGNKAYLILLPYLSLANVAAYFLWYFQPEWAFWGMIGCNLLVLLGLNTYVATKVHRLKLDALEVEPNKVQQALKDLVWSAIKAGIFFAVWMHFSLAAIGALLGEDGMAHLIQWRYIIINALGGVFFGIVTYTVGRRRLRDGQAGLEEDLESSQEEDDHEN